MLDVTQALQARGRLAEGGGYQLESAAVGSRTGVTSSPTMAAAP